jgi:hypothetical protein
LKELIKEAEESMGCVRLFSVRYEFPTEWARFQSQTPANNERYELALNLRPEHYPFWSQGSLNKVVCVDVLARNASNASDDDVDVFESKDNGVLKKIGILTMDAAFGDLLHGSLTAGMPAKPDQELKLFFNTNAMTDFWIAMTWSK